MKKEISTDTEKSSIYSQMKELLFSGEILYGERFTETQISERFNVSRMPVREAIKLLTYEGFIEKHETTGYKIKTFSEQDIIDTYIFRECIDGMLTNLFTYKQTPSEMYYLESLLEKMKEHKDSGNRILMAKIDQEFHRTIARGAGNMQMLSQFELLLEKNIFLSHMLINSGVDEETIASIIYTSENSLASYHEHEKIVESIKKGDPNTAEKCARDSIKAGLEKVLSVLAYRYSLQ